MVVTLSMNYIKRCIHFILDYIAHNTSWFLGEHDWHIHLQFYSNSLTEKWKKCTFFLKKKKALIILFLSTRVISSFQGTHGVSQRFSWTWIDLAVQFQYASRNPDAAYQKLIQTNKLENTVTVPEFLSKLWPGIGKWKHIDSFILFWCFELSKDVEWQVTEMGTRNLWDTSV